MGDYSQARVEIDLVWVPFDDRLMSVSSCHDQQIWQSHQADHNLKCTIAYDLTLPNKIKLRFSGKRQGHDTQVDSNNTVIKDLAVIVESVRLDKFTASDNLLHRCLINHTDDGDRIISHYVGFNGTMVINLPHHHVLGVLMGWNRPLVDH